MLFNHHISHHRIKLQEEESGMKGFNKAFTMVIVVCITIRVLCFLFCGI